MTDRTARHEELAVPCSSAPAPDVTIETTLTLDFVTGTGSGSFTIDGPIEDSGVASLRFWVDGHAVHGVKTLTMHVGTIALRLQGAMSFSSATSATMRGGFVVTGESCDDDGLHGAGQFAARLAYDSELMTFVLIATYTGQVHPARRHSPTTSTGGGV